MAIVNLFSILLTEYIMSGFFGDRPRETIVKRAFPPNPPATLPGDVHLRCLSKRESRHDYRRVRVGRGGGPAIGAESKRGSGVTSQAAIRSSLPCRGMGLFNARRPPLRKSLQRAPLSPTTATPSSSRKSPSTRRGTRRESPKRTLRST